MQHVYGHAENLGNECADHAAALGVLGLVSNHNLSTRWTHRSFDSASWFATCHNLGDVSEKLRDIRTEHVFYLPAPKQEIALCSSPGFTCVPSCLYHISRDYFPVISLAQPPAVFLVEGCVEPWKGQIRLFLLPRVLPTSSAHDGATLSCADWRHLRTPCGRNRLGENRTFLSFCPRYTL